MGNKLPILRAIFDFYNVALILKINQMSLSVVIPAYNCGKYIGRAVDSVLSQSRMPDEVIVVDDGSDDNTADVAGGYGEKVRLIRQDSAGASAARNAGIEAANAEWIAFLDGDDEWLPEKLELQLGLLERNEHLDWTTGNFIRCDCNNDIRRDDLDGDRLARAKGLLGEKEYLDSYFRAYLALAGGWTGTMVIRRKMLTEAGMFRAGLARYNDMDMWFRLAFIGGEIGYDIAPLAIYHTEVAGSIVKTHHDSGIICDVVDRLMAQAEKHDKLDEFRPCAAKMAGWWIHCAIEDKRGDEARKVLKKYENLYGQYYKTTTYIKSMFPGAGMAYEKIKTSLRKCCGKA